MLLAGVRGHHHFHDLSRTIPQQWARFRSLGALPGTVGSVHYGAMCGTDLPKKTLEYMCAIEVESFDGLAPEIGRMRVPVAHYAVFVHEGGVTALDKTWGAIWRDWVPVMPYRPAPTPDFERYGEEFDVTSRTGDIEIWFPVIEPSSA